MGKGSQCQERLLQACAADNHIPGRLAQRLHDGCGTVTVMVEEEICGNEAVVEKARTNSAPGSGDPSSAGAPNFPRQAPHHWTICLIISWV